jgi:hypothetical protein
MYTVNYVELKILNKFKRIECWSFLNFLYGQYMQDTRTITVQYVRLLECGLGSCDFDAHVR